jgi:hypothetical protein
MNSKSIGSGICIQIHLEVSFGFKFTGVEEQCLGMSTRVGADYQFVMKY